MADHAFAAVLTEPRSFDYREVAIPEIGADDGVLRMEAAGICGTDYEQYDGRLGASGRGLFPIIPGHEIFGWIDRAGAGALKRWGVREGDRVIVETAIGCGECRYCRDNRMVLCDNNMGYGLRMGFDTPPHLWGGYASHLYLHPRTRLHRAPDDIPTDVLSLFNPLSERGALGGRAAADPRRRHGGHHRAGPARPALGRGGARARRGTGDRHRHRGRCETPRTRAPARRGRDRRRGRRRPGRARARG